MKVSGNPTPTVTIIHRLRLMADAGGILTRDRIKTLLEAADRMEDLDERVAIMMEGNKINTAATIFQAMNDNSLFGGDADEKR